MCINCQNNETNRRGGASDQGEDYTIILANHILDHHYDIIGTQEMPLNFTLKIEKKLTDYKLSGRYRNDFPVLRFFFPKIKELKENNKIIVKDQILFEKTFNLPWLPSNFKDFRYAIKRRSLMRRIASCVLIQTPDLGKIFILNTHLDYAVKSVQKRQLKKIYQLIYHQSRKYPIIITGDFNMEYQNNLFEKFIADLKKINIARVPINVKTNASKYRQKSAIDHIFISDVFKIKNYGVVDDADLRRITDHVPIFVEFDK